MRPYNAVLDAIALGSSRLLQIASVAHQSTSATTTQTTHLFSLEELGIVRKAHPCGEKNGRRWIYSFSYHAFRFWYRFMPQHISLIEPDAATPVLQVVLTALPRYSWHQFSRAFAVSIYGISI